MTECILVPMWFIGIIAFSVMLGCGFYCNRDMNEAPSIVTVVLGVVGLLCCVIWVLCILKYAMIYIPCIQVVL